MHELKLKIEKLRPAINLLPKTDRDFAAGLCDWYFTKGYLSPKQAYWIDRFVAKLDGVFTAPAPASVATATGMSNIMALFDIAKKHLKHPAIVLQTADGYVIRLAPSKKHPGSVYIAHPVANAPFGARTAGWIDAQGVYKPGDTVTPQVAKDVGALLTEFSADPVKVASQHGSLTGRCCFCNRHLSDPQSTYIGYGPVCAKHFGLPWGGKVSTAQAIAGAATASNTTIAPAPEPVEPEPVEPEFVEPKTTTPQLDLLTDYVPFAPVSDLVRAEDVIAPTALGLKK
jgi:hypothetical protein